MPPTPAFPIRWSPAERRPERESQRGPSSRGARPRAPGVDGSDRRHFEREPSPGTSLSCETSSRRCSRLHSVVGPIACQVKHLTTARPAAVYDLIMDVERWSDWMPTVTAASWEQPGDPDTAWRVSGRYATGSASHATRSSAERDRTITPTRQHFPATSPSRTTRVTSVLKSSPMAHLSYGPSRALRASEA